MTHSTGTPARTSKMTYGTTGFVDSSTDPLNRITTYTRDATGRVLTVTRPDTKTVATAYDKQGNITQLTLPHGRIHSFIYNDVADATQATPPSLGTWAPQTVYEYNLDRQLTKVTRPDGGVLTLAYDATIGRPTSETSPLGTKTFSYSPTSGLLTGITGIGGYNLGFTYDGDAITKVNWLGSLTGEIGFNRNAKQQIESIYGSAGGIGLANINFTYDKDGLLTTARTLEITRDAQNGQLLSTKHDWMSDTWTYSPFGEPASYRAYYRWDNTTRYQATYTRNKVSQITKNVEIVNGVTTTWDYTYSNLGWLTAVTKNGAAYQSYVYDANGNRTSIVAGGTTTGATYDAQDRLTEFGTTTYSYNNAGDLISSSVGTAKTDFSYDIYGNLLSVKKPTGTTITYNTDPLGRRIKKSVNGTMVQGFLWADELHPIAELDGAGKLIATFIYAEKGNVPSAMLKGGYEYRIISDHLGSVRLVVNNNNGSILQQLDYDPYGRVIVDTNPGFQPFGYAGGLYDRDTGLVRFGRRDYDPVVGRWTSKDPIGFAGGLNLYGYVVQDPVNLVDPDGREPIQNCRELLWKAVHFATIGNKPGQNLLSELRKYDPVEDGKGGFPNHYDGSPTEPGGHYEKIRNFRRGLRRKLDTFRRCISENGDDDDDSWRPQYRRLTNLLNRHVPRPIIPTTIIPLVPEILPADLRLFAVAAGGGLLAESWLIPILLLP